MKHENRGQFSQPGKLWSLWDMLKLELGHLLETYQLLIVERANAEQMVRGFAQPKNNFINVYVDHLRVQLNSAISAEKIADELSFLSSKIALRRFIILLESAIDESEDGITISFRTGQCQHYFQHLMDICSRIRDDCEGRFFFQIVAGKEGMLDDKADHFGASVRAAFPSAIEDISEAASCLALERSTACVFHLMRALEVSVAVIANKLGATTKNRHGQGLPWGVIASNMKLIIDALPKGSAEQIKWLRVHSYLDGVNRAWRNETAHPKQTYTIDEARNVFEATKAFMQEIAPLA